MSAAAVTTLKNGLTLVALRRGSVPLVSLRLALPAGGAASPAGRSGLAELVAQLLRRGSRRRGAHAIDEALEGLGGDLGTGVDDDATRFGLTVPAARLPAALDLLLELVGSPSFPVRELASLRSRTVASIRAGLDDGPGVAERAMHRAVFGFHPYAWPVDGWTREIGRAGRADAVAFQRRRYRAGGACLVVTGAVPEGAQARVERVAAAFAKGGERFEAPPPPRLEGRRVLVVDKPDATQASIRIAGPGIAVRHPELVPCLLGSTVLGGGFSSRLVNEVRVNRGLAYGISSRFHPSLAGGLFAIRSATRVDEARQLIEVTLGELEKMREAGPTDAELAQASSYLRGSFQLGNETGEQVAGTLAGSVLQGLGVGWLDDYPRLLRETPRAAVQAALAKHLPTSLRIVAVGPARKLARSLGKLGPVEVAKLTSVA